MISSTLLQSSALWRRPLARMGFYMNRRFCRFLRIVLTSLVLLSGCDSSDPDQGGGIIGTGIILRGTASTPRTILADAVDIKSADGQRSRGLLGQPGAT